MRFVYRTTLGWSSSRSSWRSWSWRRLEPTSRRFDVGSRRSLRRPGSAAAHVPIRGRDELEPYDVDPCRLKPDCTAARVRKPPHAGDPGGSSTGSSSSSTSLRRLAVPPRRLRPPALQVLRAGAAARTRPATRGPRIRRAARAIQRHRAAQPHDAPHLRRAGARAPPAAPASHPSGPGPRCRPPADLTSPSPTPPPATPQPPTIPSSPVPVVSQTTADDHPNSRSRAA